METEIIITDLTRMSGQRVCVAGVTNYGHAIQPEFERGGITEDWLYGPNRCILVRPFARIQLELGKHCPRPPHTEDWLVQSHKKASKGLLLRDERKAFLQQISDPKVSAIFGAKIHHETGYFIRENEGNRSLGTIRAVSIFDVSTRYYEDRWDYRISFTDLAGDEYRLGVTDLTYRYYIDHLRGKKRMECERIDAMLESKFNDSLVFFRIGLSRPTWKKHPHCCFLQINGIYTFPDYLDGRCFADFQKNGKRE